MKYFSRSKAAECLPDRIRAMKRMRVAFLTSILFLVVSLNLTKADQSEEEITVTVKCRPPQSGVYTHGWGTLRLIIPEAESPYITFRGNRSVVRDTLCQASDRVGVVAFRPDGTVGVYVRAIGE